MKTIIVKLYDMPDGVGIASKDDFVHTSIHVSDDIKELVQREGQIFCRAILTDEGMLNIVEWVQSEDW